MLSCLFGLRVPQICQYTAAQARFRLSVIHVLGVGAAGVEDLVQLSENFVADIRAGRHTQEGWSNSMYGELHPSLGPLPAEPSHLHGLPAWPHSSCSTALAGVGNTRAASS